MMHTGQSGSTVAAVKKGIHNSYVPCLFITEKDLENLQTSTLFFQTTVIHYFCKRLGMNLT